MELGMKIWRMKIVKIITLSGGELEDLMDGWKAISIQTHALLFCKIIIWGIGYSALFYSGSWFFLRNVFLVQKLNQQVVLKQYVVNIRNILASKYQCSACTHTVLYLNIGLVCFLCSIYYRCKVHLWNLQLFLCVVVWNLYSTFWCVLLVRFQMGVPMFPRSVAGNSLLLPDVLYGLVFNVIVCICLGPASG